MKKLFFALVAMAIVAVSCQKEFTESASDVTPRTEVESAYAISEEKALANLESFLNDGTTRSEDKRVVSSITPIKYYETRSTGEDINCENLLYIANFENEQGYAILAADSRIDAPVIAITDSGSLPEDAIYSTMTTSSDEYRVIFNDFPLTGPGFFTTPETGTEIFMNPNTVNLYDSTEMDTLVGNFDTSTRIMDGQPIQSNNNTSTPESITISLCVTYAANQVRSGFGGPTIPLPETPSDDVIDDGIPVHDEVTYTDWQVTSHVSPMLSDYTHWHQGSPFNDLYPYRLKYLIFGKYRHAPAGCFPLAIAKIITHFEYPSLYISNGYSVDWDKLKASSWTTEGRNSAAALLKGISSGCNCLYFYDGTFCFPKYAANYMRSIGYQNATITDYNFTDVKDMLDRGKPTIMCSIPNINLLQSHSWNLDGYKIKQRNKITKSYKGETLIRTYTSTEESKMVHCDFGWENGICNGYYVSGVFILGDESVERDPGTSHNYATHYNNYLKLLTYNH